MKKIKILSLFVSYIFFFALVILSYNAIVPEKDIPLIENSKEFVVSIDNKFEPNNESIYDIIERKDEIKKIKKNKKEKKNIYEIDDVTSLNQKIYRLQVASFKREKKSIEISELINKKIIKKNIEINLIVKKFIFPDKRTFYRVISSGKFNQAEAKDICKKILEINPQCILVIDDDSNS